MRRKSTEKPLDPTLRILALADEILGLVLNRLDAQTGQELRAALADQRVRLRVEIETSPPALAAYLTHQADGYAERLPLLLIEGKPLCEAGTTAH